MIHINESMEAQKKTKPVIGGSENRRWAMGALDTVRALCGGLYAATAVLAATFLIAFGHKTVTQHRPNALIPLFISCIIQCCCRSALFFVDASVYTTVITTQGCVLQALIDLVPEALFVFMYGQLLLVLFHLLSAHRRGTALSVRRTIVHQLILLAALATSLGVFLIGVRLALSEDYTWRVYNEQVAPWEAIFVSGWSALLFGLFVAYGVVSARYLQSFVNVVGLSRSAIALKALRRKTLVLCIVCTAALMLRAAYVHALNEELRILRAHGSISATQFAWLFFGYMAGTEVLFHVLLMVILGFNLLRFCCAAVRETCRLGRTRRNAIVLATGPAAAAAERVREENEELVPGGPRN